MWQASAERILLAMMYGEFAAVLNTQDNHHVLDLPDHNVVLEMDGLSSSTDRVMFSEALTLYLYRDGWVLSTRFQRSLSQLAAKAAELADCERGSREKDEMLLEFAKVRKGIARRTAEVQDETTDRAG